MSPSPAPLSSDEGCTIDDDPLSLSDADELPMFDVPEFEVGPQFTQDSGISDERVSLPRDFVYVQHLLFDRYTPTFDYADLKSI